MAVHLNLNTNCLEMAEAAGYSARAFAAQCGISLRKFERDCVAQTGLPPHQWLNELRMRKALVLMASGLNMSEVADRLAFKRLSHFSREFKRYYGVPPTGILASRSGAVAQS